MVIGLTGGSGCGKTTALNALRALGADCYDADAIYYELLQTDAALLAAIEAAFPGVVENGTLQRKRLGAQVFGNAAALARLTGLTQPFVVREIRRRLRPGLSVIDAIGLFESGLSVLCDCTVAVTAPREARIARLMAREGVSRAYAEARLDAQRSDAEFSARCDYTLHNSGSLPEFQTQCSKFFTTLIKGANKNGTALQTEKRL